MCPITYVRRKLFTKNSRMKLRNSTAVLVKKQKQVGMRLEYSQIVPASSASLATVTIFPIPQVVAESNEAETSGSDLDKTDEVRSARPRVAWTLFCAWRISSKRQSPVGHVRPQDGGGQVGKFKGWTWPSSVREVTVQQGRVQLVTSEGKCSYEVTSVLRSGSLDLSEVVAKSPLFFIVV